MADSGEIAPLIQTLSDSNPLSRTSGASKIFKLGSEIARTAIKDWLSYAPLANLLVRDASGRPQFTVGIAVEPATFERILSANGSPGLADVPPDQDAKEFEIEFESGARIDVLTTSQPGGRGAIARYLAKLGEGIQQIEVNISDVDQATEILRAYFAQEPIYPATRAGAGGTRVNFFLVSAKDGKKVLIELVESLSTASRS